MTIKRDNMFWKKKIVSYLSSLPFDVFDKTISEKTVLKVKEYLRVLDIDIVNLEQAKKDAEGLNILSDEESYEIGLRNCFNGEIYDNNSLSLSTDEIGRSAGQVLEIIKNDCSPLLENEDYKNIFLYLTLVLPSRFTTEDVGKKKIPWNKVPADNKLSVDTAFNRMSAISALCPTDGDSISIGVFSITPVQGFISKARKLRDYWTSSVILSYLSFIGMAYFIENAGPDSILYPSMANQSLFYHFMEQKHPELAKLLSLDSKMKEKISSTEMTASFPNKFVVAVNSSEMKDLCDGAKDAINEAWQELSNLVFEEISTKVDNLDKDKWDNSVLDYWNITWAGLRGVRYNTLEETKEMFSKEYSEREAEFIKDNDGSDDILMYGTTHSYAQAILAAGKMIPKRHKASVLGKLCPQCDEKNILDCISDYSKMNLSNYNDAIKSLWKRLEEGGYGIKKDEKLCPICLIKRVLPKVIKETKKPKILSFVFTKEENEFPSTYKIASMSSDVGDDIEELDEKKVEEIMKKKNPYYAILLMDGDKMGDVINGDRLSSSKEKVTDIFLSPSVHRTISDSLNDFVRDKVVSLVEDSKGRLIYAGGDDVCAIVPVSNVIRLAYDIRQAYEDNLKEQSISAAIVIAHAKERMTEVIQDAHRCLDEEAKKERNSICVSLQKRSGGDRVFCVGWDEENKINKERTLFVSFMEICEAVGKKDATLAEKEISRTLLYKLSKLRDMFDEEGINDDARKELILYEVKHSNIKTSNSNRLAENIVGIMKTKSSEVMEIASFVGGLI